LSQAFVAQIQESVQPADALQGLLLDGIAAGYLRKQLMLEAEAAGRETMKQNKLEQLSSYGAEEKRRIVVAFSLPLENFSYGKVARYEALLDQALHRDLIPLQQLKKAALAARVVSAQKPQKSNRVLIEGEVADSNVG
jgi:hypothetical protein